MSKTYAVIGDPIDHSLSPTIHNAAFIMCNLDCSYIAYRIPKGELKEGIESLRSVNIAGFNVTIPHKIEMMKFLDDISDDCKMIGAVNTVTNDKGNFIGYNTDMDGFLEPIKKKKLEIKNENVLLLGAGGAARAILAGIVKEDVNEITIANRTIQKGEELINFVNELGGRANVISLGDVKEDVSKFKLIINSTSIGLNGEQSPISLKTLDKNSIVYDIVYRPIKTEFIKEAEKQGANVIYGYEMLLGQAIRSFEIWHEIKAPYDAMKLALLGRF